MRKLDERVYNAIKRLDEYFGKHKYVICGSVGLYIQGIYLGREPHDLDLIILDKPLQAVKRLFRIAYKQSGFMLDFPKRPLEGNECIITAEFQGLSVRVQSKEDILKCKQIIVKNHLYYDKGEMKQKQDIEKLKDII